MSLQNPPAPVTDRYAHHYVDLDERRDSPVPHRYLHGGVAGDDLRFSLYLPPPEAYQGRFFQHITPVPLSEHLAQTATGREDHIGFAISRGAMFLETNGGGVSGTPDGPTDPTIAGFRANAAAAMIARTLAVEAYGPHRVHGYAFGGSGGAYRTIAGAENTEGVWDGVVAYVPGSPMAVPNVFSVRMHAQRVLRDHLETIADRLDAGGEGDPLAGLDDEQRAAWLEVTRMGFPPRSWFGHRTMGPHAFGVLYQHLRAVDPTYFTDFWTTPGYLGADPSASVHRDRVRHSSRVTQVVTADPATPAGAGGVDRAFAAVHGQSAPIIGLRLATVPAVDVQAAEIMVLSGAGAGSRALLREISDGVAWLAEPWSSAGSPAPGEGDTVEIDNSDLLAAQTYHRHQVPPTGYPVWDQFTDADGVPRRPQRPRLVGPLFAQGAGGSVATGRFGGRMIVVACLLDREAFAWQADWYRRQVIAQGGDVDDRFRLWYVDHALHGDDERQEHPTRTVSYLGALHRALRDVAAWVEEGVAPVPSTCYEVVDGQIVVPERAAERGGVQPVVTLTADGAARAVVSPGESVTLRAEIEAPPGAGPVVAVEWDLDGSGRFAVQDVIEPTERLVVQRRHTCTEPGLVFVTVRAAVQPDADPVTPFARLENLARARLVVR